MKKIILMTLLLGLSVMTRAQEGSVADINEATYSGVDFSKVKIMGANETDTQFVTAFEGINNLVLSEASKYDLGKAFKKRISNGNLSAVSERNKYQNRDLRTFDSGYQMSMKDMQEIVDAYKGVNETGYGLVIAGELFDKLANRGSYVVIFFDKASGEIVYYKRASGKAGGFGLRNYWAATLYNVLKTWKY